jgi:hypothetical protein
MFCLVLPGMCKWAADDGLRSLWFRRVCSNASAGLDALCLMLAAVVKAAAAVRRQDVQRRLRDKCLVSS